MACSSVFSWSALQLERLPSFGTKPNSYRRRISAKARKPQKLKTRSRRPPPPSTVEGLEATSFTRLPPKDDFGLDSLITQSFSQVIRLADSKPPAAPTKRRDSNLAENFGVPSKTRIGEEKLSWVDEADEVSNDYDDEIDGNCERYELYEVGSGDEFDEEDEFDDEDDLMVLGSEEIDEDEEIQEKEKGVPAVMRCFDRAKIFVKSGNGGNGVVAFRREKFVPFGGPSGGDGGRGGNVYLEVDGALNSLLPFRKSVHFRAGRGGHGQGQQKNGAKGESLVVKVPPGTVVRESSGDVLLELLHPGQRALLLPGGRGGRGNASFKTGTNKVPKIAENGEEGPEMWLELELKLVADVGIVGAPNAGKSTFLSVVSAAQPAIANYPFTTLLPNLGVVSFDYDATMVVADLPGLLEGAHRGFGLGHEFLRHTERCSVLVHVVDGTSEQPLYEFDAIRLEIEMFSPELANKPYLVAYNKMDLPEVAENWLSFKEALQAQGIVPFPMSAATRTGTQEVINAAYELVKENATDKEEGIQDPVYLNHVGESMKQKSTAPINEFDVSHDTATNTWHVDGAGLQRFVQMTNWRYNDSERRFQHVLEACGVDKSLKKLGVKEGDTVIVGGFELVWHDGPENGVGRSSRKQAARISLND